MKVLIDSTVWSLALRRHKPRHSRHLDSFEELVREGRAVLIGPVRQEILSGIKHQAQFEKLKQLLHAWEDLTIDRQDFEQAAEFFNKCRNKGVQGTHTDFLICAIAERHRLAILTTDKDYARYAAIVPVKLLLPP